MLDSGDPSKEYIFGWLCPTNKDLAVWQSTVSSVGVFPPFANVLCRSVSQLVVNG